MPISAPKPYGFPLDWVPNHLAVATIEESCIIFNKFVVADYLGKTSIPLPASASSHLALCSQRYALAIALTDPPRVVIYYTGPGPSPPPVCTITYSNDHYISHPNGFYTSLRFSPNGLYLAGDYNETPALRTLHVWKLNWIPFQESLRLHMAMNPQSMNSEDGSQTDI